MADADEDSLLRRNAPSHGTQPSTESDISDETQDFRFLNSLSYISDPGQSQVLPRRGEKDFEPNPTLLQSDILTASRNAMHNALAHPRLHHPKNKIVAVYCPRGTMRPSTEQTCSEEDYAKKDEDKSTGPPKRSFAHGVGGDTCVCVPSAKGQHFRSIGQADAFNRVWLLPEEALYMIERGSLDIRWPSGDDEEADPRDVDEGVPMSLQAAYACLLGRGGLSLERYTVYAGLKRSGYVVLRAPSWDEGDEEPNPVSAVGSNQVAHFEAPGVGVLGYLAQLFASLCAFQPKRTTALGPVVGLGIHRSYDDIYRALSLIPAHNPSLPTPNLPCKTTPPFRLTFHIYKPSTPFRKSNPPHPDFRIAVISNRQHPTLPTLSELDAVLSTNPLDPPRGEKLDRAMYMRLRHGWRNAILAIVDQGVVSFLRFADAGFVGEKLFEQRGGGPWVNKRGAGGGRGRGGMGGGGAKRGRR